MTTVQTDEALALIEQVVLAAITELRERIEAGYVPEDVRDDLATDLYRGAAAIASFAGAVAA